MSASGHSIPPGMVAQFDQFRAEAREQLAELVELQRQHIAEHDGDTMCAYGCIVVGFGGPNRLHLKAAEMLAAAVIQLATAEAS